MHAVSWDPGGGHIFSLAYSWMYVKCNKEMSLRFNMLYATATWISFKIALLCLIQQWSPIVFFCHLPCPVVQCVANSQDTFLCTTCVLLAKSWVYSSNVNVALWNKGPNAVRCWWDLYIYWFLHMCSYYRSEVSQA